MRDNYVHHMYSLRQQIKVVFHLNRYFSLAQCWIFEAHPGPWHGLSRVWTSWGCETDLFTNIQNPMERELLHVIVNHFMNILNICSPVFLCLKSWPFYIKIICSIQRRQWDKQSEVVIFYICISWQYSFITSIMKENENKTLERS